jgi:hypothetical protein
VSKTRIDRLGQGLRDAAPTEDDLRDLSAYRETFDAAYRHVWAVMRDRLHLQPTAGRAKTNDSIIAKLRRESIRLSQMQDIVGLRVVVPSVMAQNATVELLSRSHREESLMLFLIEYDRAEGRLVRLHPFADAEADAAKHARLELEIALHRAGVEREVVLLQADSEDVLYRTHRRYFASLAELAAAPNLPDNGA